MFSQLEGARSLSLWPLAMLLVSLAACANATAPRIVITNIPPYNSFDDLAGVALGAVPTSTAVAAFIYVPGYGWVGKPTCAQPLTIPQADGSWRADVTTGGSDQLATRLAALLV